MSYAQAAELTWPQLMHALGIDEGIRDGVATEEINARQDAIFDRIVVRRRCLSPDLLRLPVTDLAAQVAAESDDRPPTSESLLRGLQRYIGRQIRSR
ncbi:MAG: hypothetical protein ABSB74_06710 [Tepidisphaeraceae bacterium]